MVFNSSNVGDENVMKFKVPSPELKLCGAIWLIVSWHFKFLYLKKKRAEIHQSLLSVFSFTGALKWESASQRQLLPGFNIGESWL